MHFDYMTYFIRKFNAFMLAIFVLMIPLAKLRQPLHFDADHTADQTNYTYVFVHGFQSWNEDVKGYRGLPYWGMFNGDALAAYREAGYTCVAPTVDPVGSVWDRTCELYAKLTGTRVDYGKAHSEVCDHDRYGEDYTGKGMLKQWDGDHPVNLIGHSLGALNCIQLTSLLAYGAQAEVDATTDGSLSDLFKGGKADWVHSCTGLAAVYNGTSLFVNRQAVEQTGAYLKMQVNNTKWAPLSARAILNKLIDGVFRLLEDMTSGHVADPDTAIYDMQPDNSAALNRQIKTVDSTYYFSLVQDATTPSKIDGHLIADAAVSDPIIGLLVPIIARTNMVTEDGMALDADWQANDGCANVISQRAPLGAPFADLEEAPAPALAAKATAGVYNVFPTVRATHMWPIGDFVKPSLDGPIYVLHIMEMINALPE